MYSSNIVSLFSEYPNCKMCPTALHRVSVTLVLRAIYESAQYAKSSARLE